MLSLSTSPPYIHECRISRHHIIKCTYYAKHSTVLHICTMSREPINENAGQAKRARIYIRIAGEAW